MSEAQALQELYEISASDLDGIRSAGEIILPRMDEMVRRWYAWLETQPEFTEFFSDQETLDRVKRMQTHYWEVFFAGQLHDGYVHERRRVGEAHARIGLSLNTYFAGMNMFLHLAQELMDESEQAGDGRVGMKQAMTRLMHLDTAVVVETYSRLVNETISAQSRSLMEMSTPVTQIWSGILLLPVVGIVSSERAQDIMNACLSKISETQARIFILDISGVGVVDTAVANHLIKITKATRLMGCECTISGVSAAIAQTIVELGIDVGIVKTTATMKDALADSFRRLGLAITETS